MKLNVFYCITAFLASAFQAFGIYHIHSLSQVTEGGVLGLTLLLQNLFSISPAVSGFLLNAFCYLLGWRTLGKTFIGYSFVSAAGFSLGYAVFALSPPLFPWIAGYPLMAAVLGALFIGIGAGICVRIGGATCGDDALAMSLSHLLDTPIERIYLISDLTVLGLSLTYIPPKRIVYSLITVILSGQMIGWIQKIPSRNKR